MFLVRKTFSCRHFLSLLNVFTFVSSLIFIKLEESTNLDRLEVVDIILKTVSGMNLKGREGFSSLKFR